MAAERLTPDELREAFSYNPESGAFRWLPGFNRRRVGKKAGRKNADGYVRLKLREIEVPAHRVAWLFVYGEWPPATLDHINGKRHDNRIANLRKATMAENAQNRRTLSKNSQSGFIGVYRCKDCAKFQARIQIPGVGRKSLGFFDTPQEAHAAYVAAKSVLHPYSTLHHA